MPRTGLTSDDVVTAAAELADEIGFGEVTMGLLAQRLGIRSPSLYKHVTDLADLRHRVATLAMTEAGEAVRDALQGRSGRDAVTALLTAIHSYATAHPGRYAATTGARFRCAATASARRTWCTLSGPSAPPSTALPCCRRQAVSS